MPDLTFEGPIAHRLAPPNGSAVIREDKAGALIKAAKRISSDSSIALGDKADALLDLVDQFV